MGMNYAAGSALGAEAFLFGSQLAYAFGSSGSNSLVFKILF